MAEITNKQTINTTLTELNGREIKEITKARINRVIDELPYLKEALTFNEAQISFAFKMTCLNSEIPVPKPLELEFEIINPNTDINDVNKGRDLVKKLIEEQEKAKARFEYIESLLQDLAPATEKIDVYNTTNTPDDDRLEHDLPIPVEAISTSGVRSEELIKPNEGGFKVVR